MPPRSALRPRRIRIFFSLRTTMLEKLRGLGKFSKIRNISDSDIPPAKVPRTLSSDKYFFLFAAFASLREIIRNSVAASLRWDLRELRGEMSVSSLVAALEHCVSAVSAIYLTRARP